MQRRLAAGMMGLRRGLSAARSLHSSLRSEATALDSFIPVIVEGARSGMQQALQNQVCFPFILPFLIISGRFVSK